MSITYDQWSRIRRNLPALSEQQVGQQTDDPYELLEQLSAWCVMRQRGFYVSRLRSGWTVNIWIDWLGPEDLSPYRPGDITVDDLDLYRALQEAARRAGFVTTGCDT